MQYRGVWVAAGVVVAIVPRGVEAQAPGMSPVDPAIAEHEACKRRRSEIYAEATAQADLQERTRLLQSMPECKPPAPPAPAPLPPAMPPPAWVVAGPVSPILELPPQPHAAETTIATVSIAPLSTLLLAAFGGVMLDGRGEVSVDDHVSVGVNAAYASLPALFSHDVEITFWTIAPRATWYMRRFSGAYASASIVFGNGHNSAGTGFLGGDVQEGDLHLFGAAAHGGWKLMTRGGFTVSFEVGLALTHAWDADGYEDTSVGGSGGIHFGWSFGSTERTRASFEARERAYEQREAETRNRAHRREQAWALTQQAAAAARANDCAQVAALDREVAQLDPELYAYTFVRDPAIVYCMTPRPAPPPPTGAE